MSKTNEQIRKGFEAFRSWVKDEAKLDPGCIWCPHSASAYFYKEDPERARKVIEEKCSGCKFRRCE